MKKYNLPYPIWDKSGLHYNFTTYDNKGRKIDNNYNSLINSLSEITGIGFYYSFNHRYTTYIGGMDNPKTAIMHSHAHSFEEVVEILYRYPSSFKILKKDEEYYSKQELKYLKRLQNFLLSVGRKDEDKITNKCCINSLVDRIIKLDYRVYNENICKKIIAGSLKTTFKIILNINKNKENNEYLLKDPNGMIYGIIHVKTINVKQLKDINENDINYNDYDYTSLNELKKSIKEKLINEECSILIEEIYLIDKIVNS